MFAVASAYAWSGYPGLRPGLLYAGKPDLFKRPTGEVHLVAGADATETLCGVSREPFPHDFPDAESIEWEKRARFCATCSGA